MNPELIIELDKLKSVYRKSYLTDGSRRENSAEHSWHLAMTLWGMASILPKGFDTTRAIQMALCHDVAEIGAGDVCAYHDQTGQHEREADYLATLKQRFPEMADELISLWQEYEAGETLESQWVRVFDKLLPFILNLQNEGRTWQEQGITEHQVRNHNAFIARLAPDIYTWMMAQLDDAVARGYFEKDAHENSDITRSLGNH